MFEEANRDSTVLFFLHHTRKVDLSQVLAKCEVSTGREKKWFDIISFAVTTILQNC